MTEGKCLFFTNLHPIPSQTPPSFKSISTKESPWIDGCCNPCLVSEQFGRTIWQPLLESTGEREGNEEDRECCLGKKKETRKMQGIRYAAQLEEEEEEEEKALIVRNGFQQETREDIHALVALLKTCAIKKDLRRGSEAHDFIVKRGLLEKDVFVGNALVNMYAKCGSLAMAQEVFDKLPIRNVISWNALISGYAQQGHGKEALHCLDQMRHEGLFPNAVTFACVLKACGSTGAVKKGQEIHALIVKNGLLERDVVLGTALLDMYAKCHHLAKAQEVFDKLPVQNIVSWNALIAGYAQYRHGEEALCCFARMQLAGIPPNAVTFLCILNACGSIGDIIKGRVIHAEIVKDGLLEEDITVANALIDMYAKCGLLAKAKEVFSMLPVPSVVSWNALIGGYAQHERGEEALSCFEWMQLEGFSPNAVTFIGILKACGSLGAAYKGQEIHAEISRERLTERDMVVGTALVDMCTKCGLLADAQDVFDKLPVRDVVSWNALMAGYAQFGRAESVLSLLGKMNGEGVKPDSATLTIMLSTCSHTGLIDKGHLYFETMSTNYGILPILEHHACMVDLFSRAGLLHEAIIVIQELPFNASLSMWHTMLGACQKWGNMNFGTWAFEHAAQLRVSDAEAYICMSNIYAAALRYEDID